MMIEVTQREAQVLDMLVEAMGNSAIADKLGLSVKTVEAHVQAIREQLGISRAVGDNSRVGIAVWWERNRSAQRVCRTTRSRIVWAVPYDERWSGGGS